MMFFNPAKAFFVKAARNAREVKMKELNYLEAELMMVEEDFIVMRKKGVSIPPEILNSFENRIDDLKKIIENKKQAL